MNHQIFISYRRDGGESLAHLLYERLTREGYRVFLDVESLRSGKFNIALYTEIQNCTDFLLLLPPHGLDRCADPEDWVRLEIEHALRCGKNIVPIMMRGFDFPKDLPPSLSALPGYNGVKADLELFDGVILRLKNQLLLSRPKAASPKTRFPLTRDPDFPEWYKEYLNESRMPKGMQTYPDPEVPKGREYYARKYPGDFPNVDFFRSHVCLGLQPLTPRDSFLEAQYGSHNYRFFDVFTYINNQGALTKYTYAVRADIPLDQQPLCAFFEVGEEDQLRLVDASSQEYRNLLLYYGCFVRLLDYAPSPLLESTLSMMQAAQNSLSSSAYGNLDPRSVQAALSHFYSSTFNQGLTLPRIEGLLPKALLRPELQISICLTHPTDQIRITSVHDSVHKANVKHPARGHLLADLVTITPDFYWLAFGYPMAGSRSDQIRLHRKPVYFAITKDKNKYISIEPFTVTPTAPHISRLIERFALNAALLETNCPSTFVD